MCLCLCRLCCVLRLPLLPLLMRLSWWGEKESARDEERERESEGESGERFIWCMSSDQRCKWEGGYLRLVTADTLFDEVRKEVSHDAFFCKTTRKRDTCDTRVARSKVQLLLLRELARVLEVLELCSVRVCNACAIHSLSLFLSFFLFLSLPHSLVYCTFFPSVHLYVSWSMGPLVNSGIERNKSNSRHMAICIKWVGVCNWSTNSFAGYTNNCHSNLPSFALTPLPLSYGVTHAQIDTCTGYAYPGSIGVSLSRLRFTVSVALWKKCFFPLCSFSPSMVSMAPN